MKTALIALLLTVSFSSHAHFYLSPSQISSLAPTLSSAGLSDSSRSSSKQKALAETLIKETNDYYQTGTISPKLAELIALIQEQVTRSDDSKLSEAEAVDVLAEYANTLLLAEGQ